MVNWKTSLFGILTFLAINSKELGVPDKWANLITGAVLAAGLSSAKDKDVTGTGINARRESK